MKLKGWFYFVPIYFDPDNNGIEGRGRISDVALDAMLCVHVALTMILVEIRDALEIDYEPTFPIKVRVAREDEE